MIFANFEQFLYILAISAYFEPFVAFFHGSSVTLANFVILTIFCNVGQILVFH